MRTYTHRMRELRKQWGGRCVICGKRHHRPRRLEFAHLRPTQVVGRSRGMPQRYHDIRKHPESYILACSRCHKLYLGEVALGAPEK